MKKPLQTALLLWASCAGHQAAAQAPGGPAPKYCGTSAVTQEYLAAHPETAQRMAAAEARTQRYITEAGAEAQASVPGSLPALLTIPVVVHVLWNVPEQYLSSAVVQSQIDELNLGFRGLTPGATPVPTAFAPLVADARINFCLATRDPNGNPTTGIIWHNTTAISFTANDRMKSAATEGAAPWNTAQYLNIWVCNMPGTDGYATLPDDRPAPGLDGVVMAYTAFGRGHARLNPRLALGRVAIHEVGHWLNLHHLWEGGTVSNPCSGNDLVGDTPQQARGNYGNPTFPRVSCPSIPPTTAICS